MKNIIVGQSGGPTAVINASLYGVIKEALAHNDTIGHVYGMVNGIEGFLNDTYMDLGQDLSAEDLELLKLTPAAYLGSCRYKLPEDLTSDFYPNIFKKLEELEIGYFFYIGGNDSMDTVMKLSAYAEKKGISNIRFVGVPKTIDNDLVATDHTPGYGSAAKFIASSVKEIARDSLVYDTYSVTIIEIMGRNAGWLTAASALARGDNAEAPDLIYLPECVFDLDKFISDIKNVAKRKKNIVIAVSEGIHFADGTYICEAVSNAAADVFGHKQLSGTARFLEGLVKERLGFKARGIELNTPQRCAAHLSSLTDLNESMQVGEKAVEAAISGSTGVMMAYVRTSNNPYKIEFKPLNVNTIANAEKVIPKDWITPEENDVNEKFTEYAFPLILGEVSIPFENGVPKHLVLKK